MLKSTQQHHTENEWFLENIEPKNSEPESVLAETNKLSVIAQSSNKKANVVNLAAGKLLAARNYKGYTVYLVSGHAELQRREMADQLLSSTGQWNAKNSVFNDADRDTYVRCTTECQFLILPKNENQSSNSNVINSERLFTQVEKTQPVISKTAGHEEKKHKTIQRPVNVDKTIEVSIYDLDRPYEDTIELPPEINTYLTEQRNEISESKTINPISSIAKSVINKVAKSEDVIKKVSEVITEKVPLAVDGLAEMIDKSFKTPSSVEDETTFSSIGYWKALEVNLPVKSGIYYVSDGKKVKPTYFNKNRNFFHKAENIEIIFWSSKKVEFN